MIGKTTREGCGLGALYGLLGDKEMSEIPIPMNLYEFLDRLTAQNEKIQVAETKMLASREHMHKFLRMSLGDSSRNQVGTQSRTVPIVHCTMLALEEEYDMKYLLPVSNDAYMEYNLATQSSCPSIVFGTHYFHFLLRQGPVFSISNFLASDKK